MSQFSILHPSRGRPEKSFATISNWRHQAGQDVEVIVSLDDDDPRLEDYYKIYARFDGLLPLLVQKNRSAVDAVNKAATIATGNIFVVVSDDFECPRNWANRIYEVTKGRRDFVLKTYDGVQQYIVTLPILDRAYYNRFGYIYNPIYTHMFCDTEFTHIADIKRRLVIRNDITFLHKHHSTLTPAARGKLDETTRRAEATFNEGKEVYLSRCREKFGMPRNTDIFTLQPEGLSHIQWLKKHGI